MAIELDPITLLQIDATVITGILILLTLANLKTIENRGIASSVSLVVVPFGLSAIFILFSSCECFGIDEHLVLGSKYLMIFGFIHVIFAVITITHTQKKLKNHQAKNHD